MKHALFVLSLVVGSIASIGCERVPVSQPQAPVPEASEASADAPQARADEIPRRRGERPKTSDAPPGTMVAHSQLTQVAPKELQDALLERVVTLPGVKLGRSWVSVPGARAFHIEPELAVGPREAFAARQEFGHLHPPTDGSLHLNLEPALRSELIDKGWAEPHPRSSSTVMLYGPRDEAELEVVWSVVQKAYERATTSAESP